MEIRTTAGESDPLTHTLSRARDDNILLYRIRQFTSRPFIDRPCAYIRCRRICTHARVYIIYYMPWVSVYIYIARVLLYMCLESCFTNIVFFCSAATL